MRSNNVSTPPPDDTLPPRVDFRVSIRDRIKKMEDDINVLERDTIKRSDDTKVKDIKDTKLLLSIFKAIFDKNKNPDVVERYSQEI